MAKKYLIVLAGPTASGKTATAIKLAKAFDAEIISADSRQFYKELSIGTAAPTADELAQVKHHFVHNLSIEAKYYVADYERDVLDFLKEYFKTKNIAIMTGGSGLFIDAVCNGLDAIPDVTDEIRMMVQKMYEEGGIEALQSEVEKVDPEYFQIVDKQNPRRLQRALEVFYQTGKPYSTFRQKNVAERDFDIIKVALLWDRDKLIERINKRVDLMMEQGLLDEVKSVYPYRHLNTLNTVGYKELFDYLDGKCTLEQAVEQIKISTRQYAKRQMTWLRKNSDYKWFKIEQTEDIITYIKKQLETNVISSIAKRSRDLSFAKAFTFGE
ncbi:MAG: tRNA (adenosine(37)-N6)-dimethylallyltransferase MiaA [Bacteroidales bacterium]|nr:tRNA (adenosine(37)-N6)-dimethylallyltransferase MiaA [Bacteroidales bacterium]